MFLDSDYSLKVSYADMDDSSVVDEKEPKKRKLKIISREEWEVGQQVWMIIDYHDGYYDNDYKRPVFRNGHQEQWRWMKRGEG